MTDREKLIELLDTVVSPEEVLCKGEVLVSTSRVADHLIANGVLLTPETGIGDLSDGYHTFNELYHHRAMLFSVICNLMPERAWKAKKHDDGTMYDGMFIVGIDTPEGQATYHYDLEPYWDVFDIKELECAPVWDGHSPEVAIRRIAGLGCGGADTPVLCKECKHWVKCESSLLGEVMCWTGQGSMYIQKKEDDFCSCGERREGE